MKRIDYEHWAEREVRQTTPALLTASWGAAWKRSLSALIGLGDYEHVALVLAKWEFLGGLLEGASATNAEHARAYARKFLPQYEPVQVLSGRQEAASDLFSMLRNGPLHGFTPAAVAVVGSDDVVAWRINEPHLAFNADGNLGIIPQQLQDDFVESVVQYAKYLEADATEPGDPPQSPTERWRRGFWMRFCPAVRSSEREKSHDEWLAAGVKRNLFPVP